MEKEKNIINDIQKIQSKIENHKNKLSILQREGELSLAGELAYSKIPALEKQLKDLESQKTKKF